MRTAHFSTGGSSLDPRRRSVFKGGVLLWTLLAQFALVGVTIFVVVRQPTAPEPPAFAGGQEIERPAEPPPPAELNRLLKRTSRPNFAKRLTTSALASENLPALPDLPSDAFNFEDADLQMMENAQNLIEQSGFLNAGRRSAAASSAASLFGVKDSGERIVVIANTSASVARKARAAGVTIERLQEEVVELIEGLSGSTLFGIVQFSQGARRFAPRLAPAIGSNRDAAKEWIQAELRGNPPVGDASLVGHEAGFALALEMEPDLVFLITDGSLNRRTRVDGKWTYPQIPYDTLITRIDKQLRSTGSRARIHAIGFELKEKDRRGLKRLTRRFGGTLREF